MTLILITISLNNVWILFGENGCWSLLGLKGLKLTCPMGKGPGKSPSNKIIYLDEQEMALCKQNERGTCPKDNLECKFFPTLIHLPFKQLDHCEVWKST